MRITLTAFLCVNFLSEGAISVYASGLPYNNDGGTHSVILDFGTLSAP